MLLLDLFTTKRKTMNLLLEITSTPVLESIIFLLLAGHDAMKINWSNELDNGKVKSLT